jgi:hypothetical protein
MRVVSLAAGKERVCGEVDPALKARMRTRGPKPIERQIRNCATSGLRTWRTSACEAGKVREGSGECSDCREAVL